MVSYRGRTTESKAVRTSDGGRSAGIGRKFCLLISANVLHQHGPLCSPCSIRSNLKQANGAGNEELLLKTSRLSVPTGWSRDGRFIIFSQLAPNAKWDIEVLPLVGNRKVIPLVQTDFDERYGQFSPDSRWVAYSSDESGRFEVYVRAFTEGGGHVSAGKWQVSSTGGYSPRWRADGKELYFNALDGKLMAAAVRSRETFGVKTPEVLFDTGHPSDLSYRDFYYDVRPDGQAFLISRLLRSARSINICLNCLAVLNK